MAIEKVVCVFCCEEVNRTDALSSRELGIKEPSGREKYFCHEHDATKALFERKAVRIVKAASAVRSVHTFCKTPLEKIYSMLAKRFVPEDIEAIKKEVEAQGGPRLSKKEIAAKKVLKKLLD